MKVFSHNACALVLSIATLGFGSGSAMAQPKQQSALAVPLSGPYQPLGNMFLEAAQSLIDQGVLAPVDTACDADRADQIVIEILAIEPEHIIGLPCIDVFDAVVEPLSASGTPMTILGLQAPDVTADENTNIRRVAPTASAMHARLATYLSTAWRDVPFAIIDDGTLSGRQLAGEVGTLLAAASLEPVFRDTYRPLLTNQASLVRRLERAGVRHVLIGGDAFDASVIGADASRLNTPLTLAGGQTLLGTPEDGVLPDNTIIASPLPFRDLATRAINTVFPQADQAVISFDETGEPVDDLTVIYRVEDGALVPVATN